MPKIPQRVGEIVVPDTYRVYFMKKFFYACVMVMLGLAATSCTSETKLEIAIAALDEECPMVVDEITTLTHVTTEDNNVVYECVIKESFFKLKELDSPEMREELKLEMKSILFDQNDSDIQEFKKIVKEAKYNVLYRYVGENTGYTFDIKIYNHEI